MRGVYASAPPAAPPPAGPLAPPAPPLATLSATSSCEFTANEPSRLRSRSPPRGGAVTGATLPPVRASYARRCSALWYSRSTRKRYVRLAVVTSKWKSVWSTLTEAPKIGMSPRAGSSSFGIRSSFRPSARK